MNSADVILALAGAYLLAGIAFAFAFVTFGAARVDPAARDAGWVVRAAWLPASAALWPVLLVKWSRS